MKLLLKVQLPLDCVRHHSGLDQTVITACQRRWTKTHCNEHVAGWVLRQKGNLLHDTLQLQMPPGWRKRCFKDGGMRCFVCCMLQGWGAGVKGLKVEQDWGAWFESKNHLRIIFKKLNCLKFQYVAYIHESIQFKFLC